MSEHKGNVGVSRNEGVMPVMPVTPAIPQVPIPNIMYPIISNPSYNPYNQIPQVLLPPSAFFQSNYAVDAGMQQHHNEVQSQVQKMATPDDFAKGSVEELLNQLSEETNKHSKKKYFKIL